MRYFVQVRDTSSQENNLSSAVSDMLHHDYDHKVIDSRYLRRLLELIKLNIAEINDRYSRCKPINKIYMCDVCGPEIIINGPRNYNCTITFCNVAGDLIL